jgi:hypothetical protein
VTHPLFVESKALNAPTFAKIKWILMIVNKDLEMFFPYILCKVSKKMSRAALERMNLLLPNLFFYILQ